jgi:hypothetical protein
MISHRRRVRASSYTVCGESHHYVLQQGHVFALDRAPITCFWCVAERSLYDRFEEGLRGLTFYDTSFVQDPA